MPPEYKSFARAGYIVWDMDTDKSLDFLEFCHGTIYLCTAGRDALARFAFRLVDKDHSGSLATEEVQNVVNIVYGDTIADEGVTRHKKAMITAVHSVPKVYEVLDKNRDGILTEEEWVRSAITFPQLIHPAFLLQNHLREKIINAHFWVKRADRIQKCCNELMELRGKDWWNYHTKFYPQEKEKKKEGKGKRAKECKEIGQSPQD